MNRGLRLRSIATLALASLLTFPLAGRAARPEPLSLAQGDWDGDGTPDLIAGFAAPRGGRLDFFRGNPDAVYPNEPAARKRREEGRALSTPFSGAVRSVALPGRPEVLAAGDFDADGRLDLAAAALGDESLVWLRGDGHGRFGKARTVSLPGRITALAAGEINRRDGIEDLLVAVSGRRGPELLLFDSLKGAPETISLPAEATALATGQLDGHFAFDAAVLAGGEVFVLSGWDRHPGAKAPKAALKRLPATAGAVSLALGRFAESARIDDVAVAGADGAVEVITWNPEEKSWRVDETARLAGSAFELQSAAVASPTGRGLLTLDRGVGSAGLVASGRQGWVDVVPAKALAARPDEAAVAVLPLRLNSDGLDDVVVLRRNGTLGVVYAKVATTYTVNTTSDTNDGVCNAAHCSLREAITLANGNAGADTIQFNIAGAGTKTITPGSFLPVITDAVTIDGTTQPGYAGTPLIELNGTAVSTTIASGLEISASNCVVRGLAINRFARAAGILLNSLNVARTGNIVEGNRLGTNPAGTAALPNVDGVTTSNQVTGTIIGGTTDAARNTLSGNIANGVTLFSASNTVIKNYIGTRAGGVGALGNGFDGVYVGGSSNTIGSANGNVIGNNGQYGIEIDDNSTLVRGNFIGGDAMFGGPNVDSGIFVDGDNNTIGSTQGVNHNMIISNGGNGVEVTFFSTGNLIRHNYIYANTGIGIELGFDGVTANDAGDADTGANNLQNYPVITAVGPTAVAVSLNSTPNTSFTIDLYYIGPEGCDPSGHGEANSRANGGTLTTNASGNGSIIIPIPFAGVFTATATGPGNNTSEFSACM